MLNMFISCIFKMSVPQGFVSSRDEPISAIYAVRSANDDAQNSLCEKANLRYDIAQVKRQLHGPSAFCNSETSNIARLVIGRT